MYFEKYKIKIEMRSNRKDQRRQLQAIALGKLKSSPQPIGESLSPSRNSGNPKDSNGVSLTAIHDIMESLFGLKTHMHASKIF